MLSQSITCYKCLTPNVAQLSWPVVVLSDGLKFSLQYVWEYWKPCSVYMFHTFLFWFNGEKYEEIRYWLKMWGPKLRTYTFRIVMCCAEMSIFHSTVCLHAFIAQNVVYESKRWGKDTEACLSLVSGWTLERSGHLF